MTMCDTANMPYNVPSYYLRALFKEDVHTINVNEKLASDVDVRLWGGRG